MFKGEWKEDPEKTNKWGGPEKYYVIADCDREKYIERSILVNMTLLRKTASEKAQTGAILRVIRALLGIKGTYALEELKKPFAVPSVNFSPDYSDASVRQAMLQQGMNSMGNMFGGTSAPTEALPFSNEAFSETFDPEENLDNPAFASEAVSTDEDYEVEYQQESTQTGQNPQQEPVAESTGYHCDECGMDVSESVYGYSLNKFGRPLCMKCQKGAGK